jgi:hypothetical protein
VWLEIVRWVTVALGVWAIIQGIIFNPAHPGALIAEVVGGVVAALFPLINIAFWLAGLAGIWLVIAPFIFGAGVAGTIISIITGALIVIFAGIRTFARR